MLALKKVAITGGLSSGKSSVCRLFEELGAYVVSADKIVHQLLFPDTTIGQRVIQLLGPDIIVNHQIDRSKIAKKVFDNAPLLKALEDIIHPAVKDEIEKQYQQAQQHRDFTVFIAEIPLLFEGNEYSFDFTVAVMADKEVCRKRFMQATGYDSTEFDRRMSKQLDPAEKARRADFVLHNEGDLDHLRAQVSQLYQQLLKETK
jgi:dephospho-CoA kinase